MDHHRTAFPFHPTASSPAAAQPYKNITDSPAQKSRAQGSSLKLGAPIPERDPGTRCLGLEDIDLKYNDIEPRIFLLKIKQSESFFGWISSLYAPRNAVNPRKILQSKMPESKILYHKYHPTQNISFSYALYQTKYLRQIPMDL